MKWAEINLHPDRRVLRQFGVVGFLIIAILAVHQYRAGRHALGLGLAMGGLLLGIAALARPVLLRWLFVGWMKAAYPLNWLVSELILALMFYGVLTPLALFFRLVGRDSLDLKAARGRASFWVRKPPVTDAHRYLRQY